MAKRQYFIVAQSGAAPLVSDESTGFVWGRSAALALVDFAGTYTHPAGLYAAAVYLNADAYHKGAKPLARWMHGAIVDDWKPHVVEARRP